MSDMFEFELTLPGETMDGSPPVGIQYAGCTTHEITVTARLDRDELERVQAQVENLNGRMKHHLEKLKGGSG